MHTTNHTFRLGTASALAILLSCYLLNANADATEVQDISKINSGSRVEENKRVGDVFSVNGGIRIQHGAIASEIGTVNDGINIEDDAEIDAAEIVNGGIDVGENVTINGSLRTMSRGINTNSGTVVHDDVVTVNGKIRLRNTLLGLDV